MVHLFCLGIMRRPIVFPVFPALAFAVLIFSISDSAFAQNTGGVSGPKVKSGDRSIGYRLAWAPDTDGFAHRLHYQHSVSDRLRFRIIAFQNNTGGDLRFRSVRLETHYQIIKNRSGWNSAVQLQGLIPDGNDGPGRIRLAWINSFDVGEDWEVRASILGAHEIGDQAREGVWLETRSEATYGLGGGYRIGAQIFNNYNSTAEFGMWNNQRHAIGPVLKGRLGGRAGFQASALFGVTERSPDADLRLFLSYSL